MELTPFLLLPVAGGFAFASTWTKIRYVASRESGHRLYFRATLLALALLLPVAVIGHVSFFYFLNSYRLLYLPLLADVFSLNSAPISLWSDSSRVSVLVLSAVAGPILGSILNFHRLAYVSWLPLPAWLRDQFEKISLRQLDVSLKNNDLERLMMRSALNGIPILLTLENGKVYVGFSIRLPNPELDRADVRILPLLSGYRDSSTHQVRFTTNYQFIYQLEEIEELSHLRAGDFEIVIPVGRICSSHLFDLDAYDYFLTNEESVGGDDDGIADEDADEGMALR